MPPQSPTDLETSSSKENQSRNRQTIDAELTPKSSKPTIVRNSIDPNQDGAVLTEGSGGEHFSANTVNLSPILKLDTGNANELQNIDEEPSGELDGMNKRKRDSLDNISLMSTDSLMMAPSGLFSSAKKPKLIRTGSITRGLRRSMSFVALKNPIASVLRSRRNSTIDPNASINSISSVESHTFNESIKKPMAEKMRSLRNRMLKSNKRELTPKVAKAGAAGKFRPLSDSNTGDCDASDVPDFKTPLAPRPQSRFTHQTTQQRTSIFTDNGCDLSTINVIGNEKSEASAEKPPQSGASSESPQDVEMRAPMGAVPESPDQSAEPPNAINEMAVDAPAVLYSICIRIY